MARQTAKSIENTYRFPNHAMLHALVKLHRVRALYRKFRRKLAAPQPPCTTSCGITPAFEAAATSYQERSWVFIEQIFTPEYHERLVENWPRSCYFRPVRQITKSYDMGIGYSARSDKEPEFIDEHPTLKAAYEYLGSDEFLKRITAFCGDGVERALLSIVLTKSYPGSSVIPHRDTVSKLAASRDFVNCIFFVSGTGGENGGGLCIINDAEYKDIVFEPKNLTNSVMIYNISAPFYHGFKPMRFGTYRWTLNAQYCGKDWLNHELQRLTEQRKKALA